MTRVRAPNPPAVHSPRAPKDPTPRLKVGAQGPGVRKLEKELKEHGLLEGKVDGFFGAKTKAAVQKLERSVGWKTDGVAGNGVWRQLGYKANGQPLKGDQAGSAKGGAGAAGSGGTTTFKTVNINVKCNPPMPQRKVLHDVRKAAQQGDLIGWNEIGLERYREAIRSLGKGWKHHPKNLRSEIPISWKDSVWKKEDAGVVKTHNGRAKVSPHRYITWVKLKNRETGETIVRMNTHLVSGAWSSPKPTTEWRRAKWNKHMMKLGNLVDKFKKQGHPVIIGGDFNRDSYKVLGKKVAYDNKLNVGTHGRSTLDYVMHVPDKELQTVGSKVQGGYASDHDAVVVKYKLK